MTRAGSRACFALRGTPAETAAAARLVIAPLAPRAALWVGGEAPTVAAPGEVRAVAPPAVASLLGQAFDAVVLDLHTGLDPDVLGQVHGFVRGGGALVLRLPPAGVAPTGGRERLAVHPFGPDDVGLRFWARFARALDASGAETAPRPLAPPAHATMGNAEQAAVVVRLAALLCGPPGSAVALTADRGRGKSSALGLAIAAAAHAGRRVVVTAAVAEAAAEVFHFAAGAARFVPVADLVFDAADAPDLAPEVIVVDEAAQVPVPILRRLARRYPDARLAFATTIRGYEGTGRGFALRFLAWLEARGRPLERLTLAAPIRWAADDALERFVFDALLLDAELAPVDEPGEASGDPAGDPAGSPGDSNVLGPPTILDRDLLARDEQDLRDLFGLLVHAHYRTTASDLQRLLDAPNLAVHAIRRAGRIVAACLVAHEGGLPPDLVADVAAGRVRLRAHALADALVAHLGRPEAGRLTMVRSVRIAVHPALRRQRLATRLVEHVHASYRPDLFGTLFGATEDLVAFRREVGYDLVRVSASRGARTGEPSVLMLRPVSAAAEALVADLRRELARELPLQLELLAADRELVLEPELTAALQAGLPDPAPLDGAARDALVRAYAFGPRTFESVAAALTAWVADHRARVERLDPVAREVVLGRVADRRSWAYVMVASGLPSLKATMRALRRAVRGLLASEPEPEHEHEHDHEQEPEPEPEPEHEHDHERAPRA